MSVVVATTIARASRSAGGPNMKLSLTLVHYPSNVLLMNTVHSKLTAQGQISVPAEVRKKLGLAPGSVIEWEERGGQVIVRKAGKYGCTDVHSALFPDKPEKHKRPQDVKEGIRKYIRKRHAVG